MEISASIPSLVPAGLAMPNKHISTEISSTINAGLTLLNKLLALGGRCDGEGAGDGGRSEPGQLAVEISLLSSTLKQISSIILQRDGGGRYAIGAISIVQKILDRCQLIYDELNTMLNRIEIETRNGMNVGKGKEYTSLVMKVRREFEKVEVKIAKAVMEACRITLHLMVHKLASAGRKIVSRRHSSHGTNTEDAQSELLSQALQLARRITIATLERLENGEQSSSATRSTSKRLRKLQRKPKVKKGEVGSLRERKQEEREKPSEWVKSLVRLEINNELISVKFSPRLMEREEVERLEYGELFEESVNGHTSDGEENWNREVELMDERDNRPGDRMRRGSYREVRERKAKEGIHVARMDGNRDSESRDGIEKERSVLGELPGDGPEDLAKRSERMEYSRGWPVI
ncbi:uncharacterized protein RAG0_09287 [Rhynchosporium agropyri]|uniref:Fungal N-terminal domain-containing protein n=1 Tax=Rhynchosporium agropyri TaxID=914238 RepID=A0A1E1KUT0_9HELO|nr:uncharacterized protein RAG0_09287 [Rhynchosporium agropyri]